MQKNQDKSKKTIVGVNMTPSVVKKPDVFASGFTEVNVPSTEIIPLTNLDGNKIQEMVDLNNTYAALVKQITQFDAAIFSLQKIREQVNKGEISLPVMMQISRTVFHAEPDKAKVLKHFDDEIRNLKLAKDGLMGTKERRRDEFVGSVIRVSRLLGVKVKDCEIKSVGGIRPSDKQTEKDEQAILEKDLDKLINENKA